MNQINQAVPETWHFPILSLLTQFFYSSYAEMKKIFAVQSTLRKTTKYFNTWFCMNTEKNIKNVQNHFTAPTFLYKTGINVCFSMCTSIRCLIWNYSPFFIVYFVERATNASELNSIVWTLKWQWFLMKILISCSRKSFKFYFNLFPIIFTEYIISSSS